VIDGLVDEGTLATEPMPRDLAPPPPDPFFAEPDFRLSSVSRPTR
jgi:primosomal protein N' (replication factor Y)